VIAETQDPLIAEVDFLHQGAAEVNQNALVDSFDPDCVRG
jgi:hypothetical protein